MYKFPTAIFLLFVYFYFACSAPQQPEINDQFEVLNHTEVVSTETERAESVTVEKETHIKTNTEINKTVPDHVTVENKTEIKDTTIILKEPSPGYIARIYLTIKTSISNFISIPKVNIVLKNVGTCIVNGAMEIVTFYLPAPMIPLIASAAGMLMPFEPVVTLRRRMPVTSYRRAFNAAVDSFMGTFDQFKETTEDPYMTRRFNRRFLGDDSNVAVDDKDKDQ